MKYLQNIMLATIASLSLGDAYGEVLFVGDEAHKVFVEEPSKTTGLNSVYVVYDTNMIKMQYVAADESAKVTWYKFGQMGGAYAEEIAGIGRDGKVTTLNEVVPNSGYIVEEGDKRSYFWVVDYSHYRLQLQSIELEDEGDCGTAVLNVEGSGDDIIYYTINGGLKKLDRALELTYESLEWSAENSSWQTVGQTEKLEGFKTRISLPGSLCSTVYTLSGDRFLTFWQESQSVSSGMSQASALAVETVVAQETEKADNMKGAGDDAERLGGSAPATILFSGYATEAASHCEWQMSRSADFENVEEQYAESELSKTFNEAGTTYWRFVANSDARDCVAESEIYTVSIGESSLQCPNAFSPGTTEGVNDEWKVSYSSIVKFRCWIFNSWGVQLCELTDPSQGWDGKYKGKVVNPGVYYYVIEAEGSEGKKYKLKGDINIVGLKKEAKTTSDKTE